MLDAVELGIFHAGQEARSGPSFAWLADELSGLIHPHSMARLFTRAAIIGCGATGSGIAAGLARGGLDVSLIEATIDKALAGRSRAAASLEEAVVKGRFSAADATQALQRVRASSRLEDAGQADLVVEAVVEDREVKRDIFDRLSSICRPTAVLATNTNALRVADLADAYDYSARVVGLHHFHPTAHNPLVEVVAHASTEPSVVADVWELLEHTGRIPIASKDAPGFVVNRFFVPWVNEAVRIHEEGANIDAIEASARQAFGTKRGPFALVNLVGTARFLAAASRLGARLGRLYAPPRLVRQQLDTGAPWPEGESAGVPCEPIASRLWGVVLHAAAALVSEEVGSVEAIDIGARVGLCWRRTPKDEVARLGATAAAELAASVERRYGLATPVALFDHIAWRGTAAVAAATEVRV